MSEEQVERCYKRGAGGSMLLQVLDTWQEQLTRSPINTDFRDGGLLVP